MTAFINQFWPAIAWFGAIGVMALYVYIKSWVSGNRDKRKSHRL